MGVECQIGPMFVDALRYTVDIHGDDHRKGASIPYVSHLLSVCAFLRDTLDDHPEKVTKSDLAKRFGALVAHIVELCTDTPPDYQGGPKPPWHERKMAYVERITGETYPLCRVPLADKIHNTHNIVMDYRRLGNAVWSRFKENRKEQLLYFRALVQAFHAAQAPRHLLDELDLLVGELEK